MPNFLLLGGLTTDYHDFAVMGPVITRALEGAGFSVQATEDLDTLCPGVLDQCAGVCNYTTGRDLSDDQFAALRNFVHRGGGYVGIHNATDTFKNQPEAIRMIGGIFVTHPAQLDIPVDIVDGRHEITQGVRAFTVFDELYVMEHWPERYHLLARTDAEGGQPIAWTREEEEGRIYYLSLGHNAHCFDDPMYLKLFQRGAQWSVGGPVTA